MPEKRPRRYGARGCPGFVWYLQMYCIALYCIVWQYRSACDCRVNQSTVLACCFVSCNWATWHLRHFVFDTWFLSQQKSKLQRKMQSLSSQQKNQKQITKTTMQRNLKLLSSLSSTAWPLAVALSIGRMWIVMWVTHFRPGWHKRAFCMFLCMSIIFIADGGWPESSSSVAFSPLIPRLRRSATTRLGWLQCHRGSRLNVASHIHMLLKQCYQRPASTSVLANCWICWFLKFSQVLNNCAQSGTPITEYYFHTLLDLSHHLALFRFQFFFSFFLLC